MHGVLQISVRMSYQYYSINSYQNSIMGVNSVLFWSSYPVVFFRDFLEIKYGLPLIDEDSNLFSGWSSRWVSICTLGVFLIITVFSLRGCIIHQCSFRPYKRDHLDLREWFIAQNISVFISLYVGRIQAHGTCSIGLFLIAFLGTLWGCLRLFDELWIWLACDFLCLEDFFTPFTHFVWGPIRQCYISWF